ncbi:hypothetical protein [Streptomyces sp. NPDC003077]
MRAPTALLASPGQARALGPNWTRASGIPRRTGWFVDRWRAGDGAQSAT